MTSLWLVVASNVSFFYRGVCTSEATLVPKKEVTVEQAEPWFPKGGVDIGVRGWCSMTLVCFDSVRGHWDVTRQCAKTHDDRGVPIGSVREHSYLAIFTASWVGY